MSRSGFGSRLIGLLITAVLLTACAPEPAPVPPVPLVEEVAQVSWMPVMRAFGECVPSEKAAVAVAYVGRGLPSGLLCLSGDVYYHTWGVVGGRTEIGRKVSVVWCDAKNGYDYVGEFESYVAERDLDMFVLFANEPDLSDQCAASPSRIARLFLDLAAICPGCRFVGPMYSSADDGGKVAQVWSIVGELCGTPCPAMASLYAHSLHVYPRPGVNLPPSGRVDRLCELVDGGDCLRPVWITEFGWRTCWPGVGVRFGEWLADAEGDARIEQYFVYTTYQPPVDGCQFSAMLMWDAWPDFVLDEMGRAFQEAGRNG